MNKTKYKYRLCHTAVALLLITACSTAPANNFEALRKDGNALIEDGRPQEAIALFDQIISQDPQNALAYSSKAVAFDKLGNHLAAQDMYQTALSLSPNSSSIKNNLAMSFIMNHQAKQAIVILEPLVKADPANKTIRDNLALAYETDKKSIKDKKSTKNNNQIGFKNSPVKRAKAIENKTLGEEKAKKFMGKPAIFEYPK